MCGVASSCEVGKDPWNATFLRWLLAYIRRSVVLLSLSFGHVQVYQIRHQLFLTPLLNFVAYDGGHRSFHTRPLS